MALLTTTHHPSLSWANLCDSPKLSSVQSFTLYCHVLLFHSFSCLCPPCRMIFASPVLSVLLSLNCIFIFPHIHLLSFFMIYSSFLSFSITFAQFAPLLLSIYLYPLFPPSLSPLYLSLYLSLSNILSSLIKHQARSIIL